jgi:hypothetical protein
VWFIIPKEIILPREHFQPYFFGRVQFSFEYKAEWMMDE